jgi:hypothetical protein
LLGAAFSQDGRRNAIRRGLPLLWLVRAGITISNLPVVVSTGVLLYADFI